MSKLHAAPLLGHVGQPQPGGAGLLAEADQLGQPVASFQWGVAVPAFDAGLSGLDDLGDEDPDPVADLFQVRRQGEIDGHVDSP